MPWPSILRQRERPVSSLHYPHPGPVETSPAPLLGAAAPWLAASLAPGG